MKSLIDDPALDFHRVFSAVDSHLSRQVLANAGVTDFTVPPIGTREIRIPLAPGLVHSVTPRT